MQVRNTRFLKKYRKIQETYRQMYREGYRSEKILTDLEDAFHISPRRIYEIIQMELPEEMVA